MALTSVHLYEEEALATAASDLLNDEAGIPVDDKATTRNYAEIFYKSGEGWYIIADDFTIAHLEEPVNIEL